MQGRVNETELQEMVQRLLPSQSVPQPQFHNSLSNPELFMKAELLPNSGFTAAPTAHLLHHP